MATAPLFVNRAGVADFADPLARQKIVEGQARAQAARVGRGPAPLSSTTMGLERAPPVQPQPSVTPTTTPPTATAGAGTGAIGGTPGLMSRVGTGAKNLARGVGRGLSFAARAALPAYIIKKDIDTFLTPTEEFADRYGEQAGQSFGRDVGIRARGFVEDTTGLDVGKLFGMYRRDDKPAATPQLSAEDEAALAQRQQGGLDTAARGGYRALNEIPAGGQRTTTGNDIYTRTGANGVPEFTNVPGEQRPDIGKEGGGLSVAGSFRPNQSPDPTTRALANAALVGDGGQLKEALSGAIDRGDYEGADLAVRNPEEKAQYREAQLRAALAKETTNRVRAGQPIGGRSMELLQSYAGRPDQTTTDLENEIRRQGIEAAQMRNELTNQLANFDAESDPTGERRLGMLESILASQGKELSPQFKGFEVGGDLSGGKSTVILDERTGRTRTIAPGAADKQYSSANAVREAYRNGDLTREEARQKIAELGGV